MTREEFQDAVQGLYVEGLSVPEMAKRCGVARQTAGDWVDGATAPHGPNRREYLVDRLKNFDAALAALPVERSAALDELAHQIVANRNLERQAIVATLRNVYALGRTDGSIEDDR